MAPPWLDIQWSKLLIVWLSDNLTHEQKNSTAVRKTQCGGAASINDQVDGYSPDFMHLFIFKYRKMEL